MACQKLDIEGVMMYHKINHTGRQVNIDCPCCGGKKKLNINIVKGVARCSKCGEISGGPMNLWAALRGLPVPYNGRLTSEEAQIVGKDFFNQTQSPSADKNTKKAIGRKRRIFEEVELPLAPVDVRDKTYRSLLDLLDLEDNHFENLMSRGLPFQLIYDNLYRSYPISGHRDLCHMLLSQGCILEGVPGFYKKDGIWTLRNNPSGFLIPQKDGRGRILGLQIRTDKGSARYITLSTCSNEKEYPSGTGAKANPHFVKGNLGIEKMIITEGPLKGDIISYYTGYSVLALQGVNAISNLENILEQLKIKGLKMVYIAFDMDIKDKPEVKKALDKLKEKLILCELPHKTIVWSEEEKGLDDWLKVKLPSPCNE